VDFLIKQPHLMLFCEINLVEKFFNLFNKIKCFE